MAELLREDGHVDPERVAEAVAARADSRPYLIKQPRVGHSGGFGQGARPKADTGEATTWGSVLRGLSGPTG